MTTLFNPFFRRRYGSSYLGMPNAFAARLTFEGYPQGPHRPPRAPDANWVYGNLVGLNDLEETDEDIANAWNQYLSANAGLWPSALRSFARTRRDETIADYRAARAEDPTLRFANYLAGLDMERAWQSTDPREGFRFNPYYRGVYLRRR